jgi:hypothetical protein
VSEAEAYPGLSERAVESIWDGGENREESVGGNEAESGLGDPRPEHLPVDGRPDQADEYNTDLFDLLVAATLRELATVDRVVFQSFRRALRKPARRVVRNLKFGAETEVYTVTFGSLVLVGDAGMETIHEVLGGAASEAGPTFVHAVLAGRSTEALYGDVLAALELSIGVFSADPEERVMSAWRLAGRTFDGWPAELDPSLASSTYLAWADVVMTLRQRSGPHMDKLLFPSGIPIPRWGDL